MSAFFIILIVISLLTVLIALLYVMLRVLAALVFEKLSHLSSRIIIWCRKPQYSRSSLLKRRE